MTAASLSPAVPTPADMQAMTATRQAMPARLANVLMPWLGDIGEGQREYEVEPISEPGVPEPAPAPVPEPSAPREPVPA